MMVGLLVLSLGLFGLVFLILVVGFLEIEEERERGEERPKEAQAGIPASRFFAQPEVERKAVHLEDAVTRIESFLRLERAHAKRFVASPSARSLHRALDPTSPAQ